MLKKIVIALAAIVAIFVIAVALQPADFRVERTTTIAAPQADVFAKVNDFHKWDAWSPWAKLDPNMKTNFEGAPAGNGAVYSWTGNSDVGEGRMTITDSQPGELVKIKLEFIKPFAGTSATVFNFKPQGNQTAVTWTMDGDNNFVGKAMCLFINMDKMVGGDFERGLAQLKTIAEKAAQ